MEDIRIPANVTISSFFDSNNIKRQRYHDVIISVKKISNEMHFIIETKQTKLTIPFKGGHCHTTYLMSHGLVTISYDHPRREYMIRTRRKYDNAALRYILSGNLSKYEEYCKNLPLEKKLMEQRIKDLAVRLQVPSSALTNHYQVDLRCKNLTCLPLEFGDLDVKRLALSCNSFGPKCSYWSWAFGNIRHTLTELSLAENNIFLFPLEILALKKLVTLNLSRNNLRTVPSSLFCRKRPKLFLNLEANHRLLFLPLLNQRVESLNVIDCHKIYNRKNFESINFCRPDLKYFAAQVILRKNLQYGSSSLPRELITYLDSHIHCDSCHNCVPQYAGQKLVYSESSATETLTNSRFLCFQEYLCFKCLGNERFNGD